MGSPVGVEVVQAAAGSVGASRALETAGASAALNAAGFPGSAQASEASQASFSQMVNKGLGEVNRQLMTSQTDLQQLAVGDVQNLHEVMIRMEEARMSFQLFLQVRNRLLEAYQDVMKMQV